MANRTVRDAKTIKGTNPQHLVEKIIRHRIYDSKYWKEFCFALTAELIVDRGMELRYIGGIYAGNIKPTPFLCLSLKMLQLQPDKEIIIEFIRQEEFKYIRALGAMYLRLTFNNVEIYKYLEPLYNDYRKLRYMTREGRFEIVHMDEFMDHLLRDERYCDIQLPRLQKRLALEEIGEIDPYKSLLDDDLDAVSESESDDDSGKKKKEKPRLISKGRSPRRERDRSRERAREREKERERDGKDPRDDKRDNSRDRDRFGRGDRDRDRGDRDRGDRDRGDRDRGDRNRGDRDRGDRDRGDRDRGDRDRDRDRRRERSNSRDRHRRDRDRDGRDKSRRDDRNDRDRGGKEKSRKDADGLSVDETNKLRAELGLAPLQ